MVGYTGRAQPWPDEGWAAHRVHERVIDVHHQLKPGLPFFDCGGRRHCWRNALGAAGGVVIWTRHARVLKLSTCFSHVQFRCLPGFEFYVLSRCQLPWRKRALLPCTAFEAALKGALGWVEPQNHRLSAAQAEALHGRVLSPSMIGPDLKRCLWSPLTAPSCSLKQERRHWRLESRRSPSCKKTPMLSVTDQKMLCCLDVQLQPFRLFHFFQLMTYYSLLQACELFPGVAPQSTKSTSTSA